MTTASSRRISRSLIAAGLAIAGTIASFAATTTTAHAASRGAYSVTLAAPLTEPRREILNGVVWRCEGDRCSAPAEGSRAASECGRVVRAFGAVARFAAPGGELTADELRRCNRAS